MTTEETKRDGPAVRSSAMLDAFDAFAQSLVTHPHRMTPEMWPKGWLFFEAGWSAAILAEREACARLKRLESRLATDAQIDAAIYAQCPDFDAAHDGPSIDDVRAIVRRVCVA